MLTADIITHRLRAMILSGEVGLGVQLKQEALAKHFGVSRIPVREALKQLQAEGLVEHLVNAGSIVARRSPEELQEILDIRIGLEMRALELAIPNMRASDFKASGAIMARYEASADPREWAELNLEFHLRLYKPCKRPRLLKMIAEIVRGVDIHLRAQQSSVVRRRSPHVEHTDILAACRDRDSGKATALLQQHIQHTQDALAGGVNLRAPR